MGKVILWVFAALGAVFVGLFALAIVVASLPSTDGQSGKSAKTEQRQNPQPKTEQHEGESKGGMRQAVKVAKAEETDAPPTAARDYYAMAETGNYSGTNDALTRSAQSQFTEDQWIQSNTALESDAASYDVHDVKPRGDDTADIYVTVTLPDGTSSERVTSMVLEGNDWKGGEDGAIWGEAVAGREDGLTFRAVRLDGLDAPPDAHVEVEHQLAPVGRPIRVIRLRAGGVG